MSLINRRGFLGSVSAIATATFVATEVASVVEYKCGTWSAEQNGWIKLHRHYGPAKFHPDYFSLQA
jgi:hypothetical protein